MLHALDAGAVQELLLSQQFLERQPRETEVAVRAAFDQRSSVEVATAAAAERLDRDGGGIAARLRFVPTPSSAVPQDGGSAARA